mmetsp:Transcript_6087/g.17431  ORF Transcript_6087/g.17431 Transcript_6087/m.17431 type:complete len:152 (+) Transcript_6087:107-562(+)
MLSLYRSQLALRCSPLADALPASGSQLVHQVRLYADPTSDSADRKTDGHGPESEGAKSGVETVVQGAGALLNKAKDAVSGSGNTAGESQTLAAGRMSQRRDAHQEDQDQGERYSDVKDKAGGNRSINETFPAMVRHPPLPHKTQRPLSVHA